MSFPDSLECQLGARVADADSLGKASWGQGHVFGVKGRLMEFSAISLGRLLGGPSSMKCHAYPHVAYLQNRATAGGKNCGVLLHHQQLD